MLRMQSDGNKNGDRSGTKPQGVNPTTISSIKIADFLKIVNQTFRRVLREERTARCGAGEPQRRRHADAAGEISPKQDGKTVSGTLQKTSFPGWLLQRIRLRPFGHKNAYFVSADLHGAGRRCCFAPSVPISVRSPFSSG